MLITQKYKKNNNSETNNNIKCCKKTAKQKNKHFNFFKYLNK